MRPQSMKMSQYVLNNVAMVDVATATVSKYLPFCISKIVLVATANIVERYFSAFRP